MRVGILGGGQLARMTVAAAIGLGIDVAIFEREADSPAGRLTDAETVGAWENDALRATFAAGCDVITLESEFVDPALLAAIAAAGDARAPRRGRPGVGRGQVAPEGDVRRRRASPARIPRRRHAGRGAANWRMNGAGRSFSRPAASPTTATATRRYAAPKRWRRRGSGSGAPGRALYAEAWVPFRRELAVMVARSVGGAIVTYPVVETVQAAEAHICRIVRAPAAVAASVAEEAMAIARRAVEAVEGVGVVGVELFEREDGTILLNEIAPRPHNSGHYTIEGCVTSQFENHLRAILDLPLGTTDLVAPAAVMVNVLGERDAPAMRRRTAYRRHWPFPARMSTSTANGAPARGGKWAMSPRSALISLPPKKSPHARRR